MSSGTPPKPRGRGRGHGRGPSLPVADTQIGGTVCRPSPPPPTTPPSVAPQTLDDVELSGASPAPEEAGQQSTLPVATPAQPPPVPPPSARQLPIGGTMAMSPCFKSSTCSPRSTSERSSPSPSPAWSGYYSWPTRSGSKAYWASKGFHQESSKNKTNRAANPTASSTVYHGGSSSIGMHKRKLEAELGVPPTQMEVFERCYKTKEDGGWSSPRATEEKFQKLLEEHQPQPTVDEGRTVAESKASVSMTEQQMWLAAARGKVKGRVFGLNSETYFSSRTYTSLLSPPPTLPQPPLNSAVEDRIGRLKEMMANMIVIMREIRASSSIA
ncbi:hypothetical protein Sango_0652600 [Sesamum angolense]|uniref:Uncharacterized protein n=1 Tax=Sesamum angolense TaxID=2727404 RepID=A0AAE2C2B7_9LAMI|nr:hypothetical protein Sango_0652600 [Sesamum angolense]